MRDRRKKLKLILVTTALALVMIVLISIALRDIYYATLSSQRIRDLHAAMAEYGPDKSWGTPEEILEAMLRDGIITAHQTIDPLSGGNYRFNWNLHEPVASNDVLAYSPLSRRGGLVLFADCHAELLEPEAYDKALARMSHRD